MKDKIEITPKILKETGFRESRFPYMMFRQEVKIEPNTEYYLELKYNKHTCTYSLDVREYFQNSIEDTCHFTGLSITSEVNSILKLFRYPERLPMLPEDNL